MTVPCPATCPQHRRRQSVGWSGFVSEGNRGTPTYCTSQSRFNPPPASSARGTAGGRPRGGNIPVSTHPPLRQRGERDGDRGDAMTTEVSTHPPLRQRGEPARLQPGVGGRHVSTHPPLRQRGEP